MSNNYNRSGSNKDYPTTERYRDSSGGWFCEEQSRTCNQCREPTVVRYNLRTHEVETFNLDDDNPNQKTRHRHPADPSTRASVVTAIAVEKRNLFERRPGDYDPVSKRIIN